MKTFIRETGKGLCAFLFVITLLVQSVLPVHADTADTIYTAAAQAKAVHSKAAQTMAAHAKASRGEEVWVSGVWENGTAYSLDSFDRIAISAIKGFVTIKTGDEFSIWLPDGWEGAPGYSVQDGVLVVSGKKGSGAEPEKSGGSAVVIGEDEPGESGSAGGRGSGKDGSYESAAEGRNKENEKAAEDGEGDMHEIVITIPAGTGLDTLRAAMEAGDLIMTDITASSVTLRSGGGNLIFRDVSVGAVDIYTESGQVLVADSTFGSLNIGMGEGDVSVSSDDELSECRMDLRTEDGTITYNGSSEGDTFTQDGNGKRSLTVQVVSGDIRVDG